MSRTMVQKAADTIIRQEKLTPEKLLHKKPESLFHPIRKHVKSRSPLALTKIILGATHPVDVNGYELPNGRGLLHEAATLVIYVEIGRQMLGKTPVGSARIV